jgi:hypothetical protein
MNKENNIEETSNNDLYVDDSNELMNNDAMNNEAMNNEAMNNEAMNNSPSVSVAPGPAEAFTNLSGMGINVDLILKSIFYGAIFYLLSLPEVYKLTAKVVGKKVDGVLVHAVVFAVLYYILTHFI